MAPKYERIFTVAVPVERAWQAFVDRRGREAWMSPPGRDPFENPGVQYPAEGFPVPDFHVDVVEEHKRLAWSNNHTMSSGSTAKEEITVTFESVETGTRISITRSGFGDTDEWQLFVQSTSQGWDDSLIDLAAYLEIGVNVSRHFSGRSSIGAVMWESSAGLRLTKVVLGGFAADAGMIDGDLLISLGGAGAYRRSDIWFVQREHSPGEELDVTYVRDGKLLSGRGRLSVKNYTELHGFCGA